MHSPAVRTDRKWCEMKIQRIKSDSSECMAVSQQKKKVEKHLNNISQEYNQNNNGNTMAKMKTKCRNKKSTEHDGQKRELRVKDGCFFHLHRNNNRNQRLDQRQSNRDGSKEDGQPKENVLLGATFST